MIQLTIHVDLLPDKLNEFNQSWGSFTNNAKHITGLTSYSMKSMNDNACEIILNCISKKQMDLFMQNEWYEFLLGAIQTLGDKSESKQESVEP